MKKIINKFLRSLTKIILPVFFRVLIKFKLNRRVINFLNEESYNSNNKYDFTNLLHKLLPEEIIEIESEIVKALKLSNSDNFKLPKIKLENKTKKIILIIFIFILPIEKIFIFYLRENYLII